MDIILAILLYLHVITPGTYPQSFINQQIQMNQPRINAVEYDDVQMQQVNMVYMPQECNIVIINDTQAE